METSRDRVADLRTLARGRIPQIIERYGGRVESPGRPDRGRASCIVHGGDGFNAQYQEEIVTCWSDCGGKSFDVFALVAAAEGWSVRADFPRVLDRLQEILQGLPAREAFARETFPPPDPVPLWAGAACTDPEAESYLLARGLTYRDSELLRFARPIGGNERWFNRRVLEGYRIALAMRDPFGALKDISLRFVGTPPDPAAKALVLPGIRTAGLAFHRPRPDSEEIILTEGVTDTLAAAQLWPESDILGVPGAATADKAVVAFAAAIRGRRVVVALDNDDAGNKAAGKAILAAWRNGAAEVVRRLPGEGHKDIAGELQP